MTFLHAHSEQARTVLVRQVAVIVVQLLPSSHPRLVRTGPTLVTNNVVG
jgi:hypothetical protein